MGEAGREVPDLEDAIEAFEALQDPEVYGDLPQIELLQNQVRESLKRLEFLLRREVEGETTGRAALTGTDDVPAGVVVATLGYWRSLNRSDGSVNSISSDAWSGLGRAPTFSDNLVEVARVN